MSFLRSIYIFLVVFSVASCSTNDENSSPDVSALNWKRKADLPGIGRAISHGFAINGKGYILGGADGGGTLNDVWEYDPSTNKWTSKGTAPFYMEAGVALVVNNKAYVGVGWNRASTPSNMNQWWEYDPATNNWARKKDFPGTGRYGGIGMTDGRLVYAGLGWARDADVNLYDWWGYDPVSDAWTRKKDNPTADGKSLRNTAGYTLDGKFYLGLGAFNGKNWWSYNPASDNWIRESDHPGSFYFAPTGFSVNGSGYVCGGGGNECWQIKTTTNTWTKTTLFASRTGATSFVIGNTAYLVTGDFSKELWALEP